MSKRIQSTKLKQLLEGLKVSHISPEGVISAVPYNTETEFKELPQYNNAHQMYNDIALQIKVESDLGTVREIALYYLDAICSEIPDDVAQRISDRVIGN